MLHCSVYFLSETAIGEDKENTSESEPELNPEKDEPTSAPQPSSDAAVDAQTTQGGTNYLVIAIIAIFVIALIIVFVVILKKRNSN